MAVYSGAAGIAALRKRVLQKSRLLVGESVQAITERLVDESPVGLETYPSKFGNVTNIAGDFKNSWSVGLGYVNDTVRGPDKTGAGAISGAMLVGRFYNLESSVFITNSTEHASEVEHGWGDRPEHGWHARKGYNVVANNTEIAVAILHAVAGKVSTL